VFFSYDGPDGVRAKADYVRAGGFGGIMFWELGGDDGTQLRAIVDALTRPDPASSAGRRR
jgi:chitinase